MKISRKFLLLLFGLLTYATTLTCKTWTPERQDLGLSARNVSSMEVDHTGMLWIGTDEGLNLLANGATYQFFSKMTDPQSLLDSDIKSLAFSTDGSPVALTKSGLSFFNRRAFNFGQVPLSSTPQQLLVDAVSGNYWVPTENNGISILDSNGNSIGLFKTDPLNPLSISTSRMKGIRAHNFDFDDEKYVFVATSNGFNVFDREKKTFSRFFKREGSPMLASKCLGVFRIDDTALLVATNRGLNIFDTTALKFTTEVFLQGKNLVSINKVDEDRFIINIDGGLLNLDGGLKLLEHDAQAGNFQVKNLSQLPNSLGDVSFLAVGQEKFIWRHKDLYVVREIGEPIEKYSLPGRINDIKSFFSYTLVGTTEGLYELSKRRSPINTELTPDLLYYASDSNKEIRIFPQTISVMDTESQELQELDIPYALRLSQDAIFDADDGIVTMFSNGNLAAFLVAEKKFAFYGLPISFNQSISIDNLKMIGRYLFLSTGDGIIRYEYPESDVNDFQAEFSNSRVFFEYNALLNNQIPRSFSDIAKIETLYWITSPDIGLSVHEEDLSRRVREFKYKKNDASTLASKTVLSLEYVPQEEKLFLGTKGQGLFEYSLADDTFTQFTTENGLLSNNIQELKLDPQQRLWIRSSEGLNYLQDKDMLNVNVEDGLDLTSFHESSLHATGQTISLSGFEKIQTFDPEDVLARATSNSIYIARVQALDQFNQKIGVEVSDSGVINIDYTVSALLFEVYVDQAYKSGLTRFFYSLGDSAQTIPNGTDNVIQISSLPYYDTKLNIFGLDYAGHKTKNSVELLIRRNPPLWLTYEALFLYLLSILSVLVGLIRYRETQQRKKLENDRREKELAEAKNLQQSLLPKRIPEVDGVQISAYLKTSTEVGGDYYDFYETENALFAICGDATGHGVTSGIMVSVTKAGLNGIQLQDPGEILGKLNSIVKRVNFGRLRMSLSVAKITTDALIISSAAMPPAYVYESEKKYTREILVPNLPLGGLEHENFESVRLQFQSGDVLVMLSDGLPELPNEHSELLNYDKLLQCIAKNAEANAEQIKDALVELSLNWAKGALNPDDITIVVLKRT